MENIPPQHQDGNCGIEDFEGIFHDEDWKRGEKEFTAALKLYRKQSKDSNEED